MFELNTEFGFFWQAKTSMVYPALRKLKNRGLIRENEEKSDESIITSKYYELTEEGLQKLQKFRRPFHPPFPFFQGHKFKPPSSPFIRFQFWEKFVDADTIIEKIISYREHLIKELERIDEKIQELRESEEYKEVFHNLDIQ
ncbi:MAG: helix-turn-helix transcriptional regulator [Candidatus Helarchaeota archaeon]|nr:helix-turn-helix transcriptional regulator [Candidatus Helarchaeota archaeon]